MLKTCIAIGATAFAMMTAAPASAVTIHYVSGVVYEGGVSPDANAPAADMQVGDFDANANDPLLIVQGDTSIYGGVAHRTSTKYFDAWSMDFGTDVYQATFNWAKTSDNFDGQLLVNMFQYLLGGAGSEDLGQLTGVVTFVLDPLFGQFGPNPDEVATWDLQLTKVDNNVGVVPLPAGGLLLLTGLAGLGIMRRRANG